MLTSTLMTGGLRSQQSSEQPVSGLHQWRVSGMFCRSSSSSSSLQCEDLAVAAAPAGQKDSASELVYAGS